MTRPTRAQFAKIHIAKKELPGMDDGAYREILRDRFGAASSKDLTRDQAEELIAEFKARGWTPRTARKGRPFEKLGAQGQYRRPMERKMYALWCELKKWNGITNASPRAMNAWAKRSFKVDHPRFMKDKQCHAAIEMLRKWLERLGWTDPTDHGRDPA